MLISILSGLLLGFVLSIPPGPVGVAAMKIGLNRGKREGMLFSLGSGVMDFIYCTFAIFTTSAAVKMLGDFGQAHPTIIIIFQLLIVLLLILYGVFHLRKKSSGDIASEDKPEGKRNSFYRYVEQLSHKGPFLLGIAVALTNIANPAFLPFLTYVTMNVHGFGLFENLFSNNLLFAITFGLGNFLWLYSLIRLLIHYKSRMSARFITRINQFAGYSLIGVGTLLGYRVAVAHWHEFTKLIVAF